ASSGRIRRMSAAFPWIAPTGPRALPPSIANAGPPGCLAKDAICAAAALRFTSGCAFSVAEHWLRHMGLEKNAKLIFPGLAGSAPFVAVSPVGGAVVPSSKRQIDDVYQSVDRDGKIALVP